MAALDVGALSQEFQVRLLAQEDIPDILRLCRGNPLFYVHCPPEPSRDSILQDMRVCPPGMGLEDKYYIGYYQEGRLAAVMDLIPGFPHKDAAFIGFFMVDAACQGTGMGSRIIGELCSYFRDRQYTQIRLGWVQGNPQSEHFWHKNQFQENGAVSHTPDYAIICAQRNLSSL